MQNALIKAKSTIRISCESIKFLNDLWKWHVIKVTCKKMAVRIKKFTNLNTSIAKYIALYK